MRGRAPRRRPTKGSRRSSGAWGNRYLPNDIRIAAATLCLTWAGAAGALSAQERATLARCDGQPITSISIRTEPPYPAGFSERFERIAEAARAIHVTTRPSVVRRYLVFGHGDRCSRTRLEESARILRTQPFIADAEIVAYQDGDGVRVEVVTVDELSIVGSITPVASSPFISALRLGDLNVAGGGIELQGQWRDGRAYRDEWGGRLVLRQFVGRPWELAVTGVRHPVGGIWELDARHAFLTDLQRLAWRVSVGERDEYFAMLRENGLPSSLRVERSYSDVGGVVRIGFPGRLSLFGASLSREEDVPGDQPVIIGDEGLLTDTSGVLADRYRSIRTARINAIWGVRSIRFMRVNGFDALAGVQDVRKGLELGTLLGRSLSVIGAEDDDIFVAINLYVAEGTPRAFFGMQLLAEGRESYTENRWDGILSSGRAASYLRFGSRRTIETSLEWSGGWRQRIPFQLLLGGFDGVRGYRNSQAAGSQRLVLRHEERWRLWRAFGAAEVGMALFGDAGRVWAGDAPFGLDRGPVYGAGAGLLVAVPPHSRRMWRLDFAIPVSSDPHARWELRLQGGDFTRMFWRDPSDVARNRERTTPLSIYRWP